MDEKSINARILAYQSALADGEIQATYQFLVGILQQLKSEFARACSKDFSVGSVQHGYIDVTYFYVQNDFLKRNKLKFGVVLNHKQASFELWLLGQTKPIQREYWQKLQGVKWVNTVMPEYSIFEAPLLSRADFEDVPAVIKNVIARFESLSQEIFILLKDYAVPQ